MMRPRGTPPMPSAISRPSEPVEITSVSAAASCEPSFIIEPLPKARSIWPSAASKARCLSIASLSKRRNAVCIILPPLFHSSWGHATHLGKANVHDLFRDAMRKWTRQNKDQQPTPRVRARAALRIEPDRKSPDKIISPRRQCRVIANDKALTSSAAQDRAWVRRAEAHQNIEPSHGATANHVLHL